MSLVDAYLPAIKSMDGSKPRPLQPFAAFTASQSADTSDVSLGGLRAYLGSVTADEPLRKELHLAVAGWDSTSTADWTEATVPHSIERRHLGGC